MRAKVLDARIFEDERHEEGPDLKSRDRSCCHPRKVEHAPEASVSLLLTIQSVEEADETDRSSRDIVGCGIDAIPASKGLLDAPGSESSRLANSDLLRPLVSGVKRVVEMDETEDGS